MAAIQAQINKRYQVVIPKEVRQKLDLQPHSTLFFIVEDDEVRLLPKPKSFTDALRGLNQRIQTQLSTEATTD